MPKIKKVILILTCLLLIAAMFSLFTRISKASPQTKGQTKIWKQKVYISETPRSDEEIIRSLPYGDLIWKTYGHESTWGKYDGCRAQGKYNGFGFEQNDTGYVCFGSLKEVAVKVSQWFEQHLKTITVRQALCYYCYGKLMDNCDYADYSLNLSKENDGKGVNKSG